jgi:hypothetical protein
LDESIPTKTSGNPSTASPDALTGALVVAVSTAIRGKGSTVIWPSAALVARMNPQGKARMDIKTFKNLVSIRLLPSNQSFAARNGVDNTQTIRQVKVEFPLRPSNNQPGNRKYLPMPHDRSLVARQNNSVAALRRHAEIFVSQLEEHLLQ